MSDYYRRCRVTRQDSLTKTRLHGDITDNGESFAESGLLRGLSVREEE